MKVFKQILAVACAVYFLIAGSGYNLIRYCCEDCADEGIEAIVSESCEAIHHKHEHDGGTCCNHTHSEANEHENMACSDMNHQADGCYIWRLQTDTPVVIAAAFEHFDFGAAIEFPHVILSFLHEHNFSAEQTAFSPPDDVPLLSGRDILTYHAILLI